MKNANQIKLAKELLHLAKSLMALKPDDHGPVIPETKKEFLDLLLSRINRIEYSVSIVEDDSSRQAAKHKPVKRHQNKYPSTSSDIKDDNLSELVDLKVEFEELKKKIPEWLNEGTHNQSFYGVDFIKRLLESGCNIVFVPRSDDPSKMDPRRYGLEQPEKFRQTMLKKINENKLIFLKHEMRTHEGFPLDVFTTDLKEMIEFNTVSVYIKFKVMENVGMFDLELHLISLHDARNQKSHD